MAENSQIGSQCPFGGATPGGVQGPAGPTGPTGPSGPTPSTFQTTDATPNTSISYPMVDATIITYVLLVSARRSDGVQHAKWRGEGTFYREGGTVTTLDTIAFIPADANEGTVTASLAVSSTNLVLTATGVAAQTWNWTVIAQPIFS